jgi:hypothetical protein
MAFEYWRGLSRATVLATMCMLAAGGALADTPTAPASPAAGASAADAAPALPAATTDVNGFRSATFGMSEADVRAAIVKDFGVKPTAIISGQNAAERTQVLSVPVPDLLQGGGTAQVSYVFGYKSKTLIQIGVSWSRASDPKMTPDELYADGDVLRSHFMTAGYQPASIKTGLVLPNGILLFRGEDASGHATILILQGDFKAGADGKQRTLTPTALALLYSADPQNPDVFKVAPGQF